MVPAATTVGGYLQSLPNDRRVAMARVCSMIRRSARGVRESMRFGLAFYELEGPIFAVESNEKSLTLFIAEKNVIEQFKDQYPSINAERSCVEFNDLMCLPLEIVEKVVRTSLSIRRARKGTGNPTQTELLQLWHIEEAAAAVAPPIVRIVMNREDEEGAADTQSEELPSEALLQEPSSPVKAPDPELPETPAPAPLVTEQKHTCVRQAKAVSEKAQDDSTQTSCAQTEDSFAPAPKKRCCSRKTTKDEQTLAEPTPTKRCCRKKTQEEVAAASTKEIKKTLKKSAEKKTTKAATEKKVKSDKDTKKSEKKTTKKKD